MKSTSKFVVIVLTMLIPLTAAPVHGQAASDGWRSHEMSRPKPDRVAPAAQQLPVPPPAGAVILFDGTDLSGWESTRGGEAQWTLGDGYFEVRPGAGAIRSEAVFGDVQLHVEWASPDPAQGSGQDRGNSGVFLMERYEVQVLDSYEADTYADGQAAALYGQYPPLYNATRAPGAWQTYDIFFRRPRFEDGALLEPARVSVVHNGVLVQNNEEYLGPTNWLKHLPYEEHEEAAPIQLQDHGHRVRFRNIWALPMPARPLPPADYGSEGAGEDVSAADLQEYVGAYARGGQSGAVVVSLENGRLFANLTGEPLELLFVRKDTFQLKDTGGQIVFERDDEGRPAELVFHLGGARMPARRR